MKSFEVNTHHGYLNTEIVIKCSSEACEVQNLTTGVTYNINSVLAIKLCAGKHILYCAKDDHKVEILIEDAIKLGGSQFKEGASFVSEETPWIAITMKDRIYFYNRDTKSEFVEHNLSPASVKYIGGKGNEYFLFETEGDYSVFNAQHRQVTFSCNGLIYSNNHLVIFENKCKVFVYDYINENILLEFEGQYSIYESNLFYVGDNCICKMDLNSNEVTKMNSSFRFGEFQKEYVFSGRYALEYYANYETFVNYKLIDLLLDKKSNINMDYFITSFCGKDLKLSSEVYSAFENIASTYLTFKDNNKEQLKNNHILSCLNLCYYEILDLKDDGNNSIMEFRLIEEKVDYKRVPPSHKYLQLYFKIGSPIGNRSASEIEEPKHEDLVKSPPFFIPSNEGRLICHSKNIYVSFKDDKLLERNIASKSSNIILENIFDSKKYINAYFNSEGNSVVAIQNGNTADILGFSDLKNDRFDLTNSSICYTNNYGVNGYKPELDIIICDGRKPVWRDPMTLNIVREEDRSECVFKSPDGRYVADNDKKMVYHNIITNSDITREEYNALHESLDWGYNPSDEEKKQKTELREQFVSKNPSLKVLSEYKDGNYTQIFVKQLYYAHYRKAGDSTTYRIFIGENVSYLNYISFSYDSKFFALGAKINGNSGIFLLYDLVNNVTLHNVRTNEDQKLFAVWMAMFNNRGDVAYYDSTPDTYILNLNNGYKSINKIGNRSLLCFSRSGRYVAFSNQGYVAYNYGKNYNWGHQPSGNVYIHSMDDPTIELKRYCDLGEHIQCVADKKRKSRAGNVASAAFSTDEKRFLVVGDDGVVVVRNLRLPETTSIENIDPDELPF